MRTLIDIDKEKLQALKTLASQKHVSRASLIRQAIDDFLKAASHPQKDESAFGILKGSSKIDGLEFQRKLRSEWNE